MAQGGDPGFLHGLERAGVEVALDLAEPGQHLLVADGEPDSPASHVEGLRQRVKFDPDLLGAIRLQEAGRAPAVIVNLGIGRVMAHDDPVLARELDYRLKKSWPAVAEVGLLG